MQFIKDNFQALTLILLVALVATNVWTITKLQSLECRVERLPTSTGSPTVNVPAHDAIRSSQVTYIPENYRVNEVEADITFEMREKHPQSETLLQYSLGHEGPWQTIEPISRDEPLSYQASVWARVDTVLRYRAIERIGGETVRVSNTYYGRGNYLGSGSVLFGYSFNEPTNQVSLYFRQDPLPRIGDWQLNEIMLHVTYTNREDTVPMLPDPRSGTFRILLDNASDIVSVDVKALFRDGEEREATIPWPPGFREYRENEIIQR